MERTIPARATVIIPTFGQARFAKWAIESVCRQTVRDLEICVICDGSPPDMVDFFLQMAKDDSRIQVFSYPKSPRTGEPYRDEVIRKTTGKIICYCCHDDLWLPDHVEAVERTLEHSVFTHSIHAAVSTAEERVDTQSLFSILYLDDLASPEALIKLKNNINFFGLTYGAHTRQGYFELSEGWVTTPDRQMPTDLYMWKKLATQFADRLATTRRITALCFPQPPRKDWNEQRRYEELEHYAKKIQESPFIGELNQGMLEYVLVHERRQNQQILQMQAQIQAAREQQVHEAQEYQNVLHQLQEANRSLTEQLSVTTSQLEHYRSAAATQSTDNQVLSSENQVLKEQLALLSAKQSSLKHLLSNLGREIGLRIKTGHRTRS